MKYQRHSVTSRAAAASMMKRGPSLRAAVYQYLQKRGKRGAIDEKIIDDLGLTPNTGRARRIELMDQLLVGDTGRQRRTRSGRQAVVWAVLPYGKAVPPARRSMRSVKALQRRIAFLEEEVTEMRALLERCAFEAVLKAELRFKIAELLKKIK